MHAGWGWSVSSNALCRKGSQVYTVACFIVAPFHWAMMRGDAWLQDADSTLTDLMESTKQT